MYTINNKVFEVENYLDESSELKELINNNQLIYIISGCGMGKTYFTKNYLMKNYVVVNVNFLNVLNLQNFSDTYSVGDSCIEEWKGNTNITINIQNMDRISDECIEELAKNNGILVVDEIQKMYQDSYYRTCCGDRGIYQLQRFKEAGVKIIIYTGTPLKGIDFDDFETVTIKKTNITKNDSYVFNWMKGLNKVNTSSLVENLVNQGFYPIILANERRNQLFNRLVGHGINVGYIESNGKSIDGSETKYLIDNSKTPDDFDCLLCTSVIQEGLNLNEYTEDKRLVFITYINEIYAAPQLIQFAGRARNQQKNVILGYNNEEEFDLNFEENIFEFEVENYDSSKETLIKETSSAFNSKKDWENYITNYTHSVTFIDSTAKEANVLYDINKIEIKNKKTDWIKYGKELFKDEYKGKTIVNKMIRPDEKEDLVSYKINNNKFWIYTSNVNRANLIKYAIDNQLIYKHDLDRISEEELIKLCNTVKLSRLYKYALTKSKYIGKSIVIDYLRAGNIDDKVLYETLMEIFKMEYRVNGEVIDTNNALTKDQKRKIKGPVEELLRHKDTMKLVLRKITNFELPNTNNYSSFIELMNSLDIIETFLREEKERKINESKKGAYNKKQYTLINNSDIIFNNLNDCYLYVKENLNYKNSFDSFQKRDWKKMFNK